MLMKRILVDQNGLEAPEVILGDIPAIVYEMDHGFYVGDSLGDFNSELRAKQMIHKNPWVSWFSGKYIMEIKPISTEREEE